MPNQNDPPPPPGVDQVAPPPLGVAEHDIDGRVAKLVDAMRAKNRAPLPALQRLKIASAPGTLRVVAQRFCVSVSTVHMWRARLAQAKQAAQEEHVNDDDLPSFLLERLGNKPRGGRRAGATKITDDILEKLRAYAESDEGKIAHLSEVQQWLVLECDVRVSVSTVWRTLRHKLGHTRKTVTRVSPGAISERNLQRRREFVLKRFGDSARQDKVGTVEERLDQRKWYMREDVEGAEGLGPENLLFVDETGVNRTTGRRRHGRSRRGTPCTAVQRGGKGKNHSTIIAIGWCGVLAHKVRTGGTKRVHFVDFIDNTLAPAIRREQEAGRLARRLLLIMDNASIHKGAPVADALKKAGVDVEFQPPYAPNMHPTEWVNAQMKRILRARPEYRRPPRVGRNADPLDLPVMIGEALAQVSTANVRAYYGGCGWRRRGAEE